MLRETEAPTITSDGGGLETAQGVDRRSAEAGFYPTSEMPFRQHLHGFAMKRAAWCDSDLQSP